MTVEERACIDERGFRPVDGVGDAGAAVHIEKKGEYAVRPLVVEKSCEAPQIVRFAARVDELLIGVQGQTPAPGAKLVEQRIRPGDAVMGFDVGIPRLKDMAIGLGEQQFTSAIGRAIVDRKKAVNAETSVIFEEPGEPSGLVPHWDEAAYFLRPLRQRSVIDAAQEMHGGR
jgi:hypothetical protein